MVYKRKRLYSARPLRLKRSECQSPAISNYMCLGTTLSIIIWYDIILIIFVKRGLNVTTLAKWNYDGRSSIKINEIVIYYNIRNIGGPPIFGTKGKKCERQKIKVTVFEIVYLFNSKWKTNALVYQLAFYQNLRSLI